MRGGVWGSAPVVPNEPAAFCGIFYAKAERMLRFAGVIRLMDDASGRTFIPYFSFLFWGRG